MTHPAEAAPSDSPAAETGSGPQASGVGPGRLAPWLTETWGEAAASLPAIEEALERAALAAADLGKPFRSPDTMIFSGAGSSYYVAQVLAAAFRELSGRPAIAAPLSDLILRPEIVAVPARPARQPIVLFSRSGRTSEALEAAEGWHRAGHPVIGVTCRGETPMAGLVDHLIVLPQADERSVVMTRAFSAMLTLGLGLVARTTGSARVRDDLAVLPARWSETAPLVETAWTLAARPWTRVVGLGGGATLGVAREFALKLLEAGQVATDAFEALEFRHGPISMCQPGVLVVGLVGGPGRARERQLAIEVRRHGATAWTIERGRSSPDDAIPPTIAGDGGEFRSFVGSGLHHLASLPLLLAPLQALAIGAAVQRGLDPDQPRIIGHVVVLDGERSSEGVVNTRTASRS